MNDESRLRDALLDAEMRREAGELSEEQFRDIEADVLAQIREMRERRTGGADPLTLTGGGADVAAAGRFEVEASITGDFHDQERTPGMVQPHVARGPRVRPGRGARPERRRRRSVRPVKRTRQR